MGDESLVLSESLMNAPLSFEEAARRTDRAIIRLMDTFIHPDERSAMQESLRVAGYYIRFRQLVDDE